MGIGPEQLRDKALLALEEALQDLRYGQARRTFAVRFALAYLWAYRPGSRAPFEDFWRALASSAPWRIGPADQALAEIYRTLEVRRDDALAMQMWQRAHERYQQRHENRRRSPEGGAQQGDEPRAEERSTPQGSGGAG